MTDGIAPTDVPRGVLDWRHSHLVVVVTAQRTGGEDAVIIEMTLDEWYDLPPVQYAIKTELSRKQPRRPTKPVDDRAAELPVPRGHIEWRDGQNWVVLTARVIGRHDVATVEMTLGRWFALMPVRAVVEERLERWQSSEARGLLDWRRTHWAVLVTACRAGSDEVVTVEITLAQWLELPPVQFVIKTELSRKQPRRPTKSTDEVGAALPVPRGHIGWRDGQNWVSLTAQLVGSQDAVTVEMTLGQWFALVAVRAAVEEHLERWESNKARSLGEL
jgi:hypothetical protein